MAKIELKNIGFTFKYSSPVFQNRAAVGPASGDSPFAIQDLDLTIPDGTTMVILGPSGCGKSTLLYIIGGLLQPTSGQVLYDGVDMEDVKPGARQIGMVFQNYALYPHYTSKDNVLSFFTFKRKTPELDELAKIKFEETSRLLGVELRYLMGRMPGKLSGGERQKVAIGRCITRDPRLFLLDEPFSNLDQKLRDQYRVSLKKLLDHFRITTVYVTHDQREALIFADHLTIMNEGQIEQVGTPQEIYEKPKNIFVAGFFNWDPGTPAINLVDGRVISPELGGMTLGVRPGDIELCEPAAQALPSGTPNYGTAYIDLIQYEPTRKTLLLSLDMAGSPVTVRVPYRRDVSVKDQVWLHFKKYHLFNSKTGLRVRTYSEE